MVELVVHLHNRDASFFVAMKQGFLDRGGATIFGEQRGVDVDGAEFGYFEDFWRKNHAEGDNNEEVGFEIFHFFGEFTFVFRLDYRQVESFGSYFDWRCRKCFFAPDWLVRLAYYCQNVDFGGLHETFESFSGKFRGSEEYDFHNGSILTASVWSRENRVAKLLKS